MCNSMLHANPMSMGDPLKLKVSQHRKHALILVTQTKAQEGRI